MKKSMKSLIVFLVLILIAICINVSNAAPSYSITSGISTIQEGKTYNIKIKASGLTGRFNISHSDNVSVNCSSIWVENGKADKNVIITAKSEGKATVTFSPDSVADASTGDLLELSSKTDTVTVKAKTSSGGTKPSPSPSSSPSPSPTTTTKPTFTSKNQTVYADTDNLNVRSSYSTSSSILGKLNKGDSVKRTGIATASINGILWSKVSYNGKTGYISSSYLTTTKPKTDEKDNEDDNKNDDKNTDKSKNTNLKSLTVTPTGLSPAFAAGTTEYTMTVGSDIDKIDIEAIAEDDKADVEITGNTGLKIGSNPITIVVTAEDKTTKTYRIVVTKESKKQLQLTELLVEGLPLDPEFDSNIYEYTLTLEKSDVKELNITATPSKTTAEVEIVGNTDLKPGTNIVTILVKSADGEETSTYQITVTIPTPETPVVENTDNSKKLYLYIGVGVAVLLLLILISSSIRKRKSDDDEDEDDYRLDKYNDKEEIETKKVEKNEPEIRLEDLPKLRDEELPKSLRKNTETANMPKESAVKDNTAVKIEEKIANSGLEQNDEMKSFLESEKAKFALQEKEEKRRTFLDNIEENINLDNDTVKTERSKKLDEFYTIDEDKPKRRGRKAFLKYSGYIKAQ